MVQHCWEWTSVYFAKLSTEDKKRFQLSEIIVGSNKPLIL